MESIVKGPFIEMKPSSGKALVDMSTCLVVKGVGTP